MEVNVLAPASIRALTSFFSESDCHMVEGKSVGNENQRARALNMGGGLLHGYPRQPWNG
jgi:hypothetical protein